MINNEYMYTLATRIRGASIVTLREENTTHFGWRIGEETMLGCWVVEVGRNATVYSVQIICTYEKLAAHNSWFCWAVFSFEVPM